MRRHLAIAGRLLVPTVRLVPWWHLVAASLLAGLALWFQLRGLFIDAGNAVSAVRLAMVLVAVGVAFWLDGATDGVTTAKPSPVWLRILLRVLVVVPAVAALTWAGIAVVTNVLGDQPGAVVAMLAGAAAAGMSLEAGLWLEAATIVVLAWTAGLVATRAGLPQGGFVAAPTLLAVLVAARELPARFALIVDFEPVDGLLASDPAAWQPWLAAHQRMGWLLVGLVVVAGVVTIDPARRLWPRRRRGSRTNPKPASSTSISSPVPLVSQGAHDD